VLRSSVASRAKFGITRNEMVRVVGGCLLELANTIDASWIPGPSEFAAPLIETLIEVGIRRAVPRFIEGVSQAGTLEIE
jgi:hypothetical protein